MEDFGYDVAGDDYDYNNQDYLQERSKNFQDTTKQDEEKIFAESFKVKIQFHGEHN